MLENDRLVNLTKKKNKILHGNYAKEDPHAEFTSAFINQAITQAEGHHHNTPIPSEESVIQAKNWVDHNEK